MVVEFNRGIGKVELVKELIGLAASDGHFHGAELGWIMVFSVTIGLDPKKIQKEIEGSHEIDWNEATESMKNFAGSISQQYKQIGNAVPCNLGKELGYSIIKFLNKVYSKSNKSESSISLAKAI